MGQVSATRSRGGEAPTKEERWEVKSQDTMAHFLGRSRIQIVDDCVWCVGVKEDRNNRAALVRAP